MRDPPLRLLKSSTVLTSSHRTITSTVQLSHYKSSVYSNAPNPFPSAQPQVLCAVDASRLSKTHRAYREAPANTPILEDKKSSGEPITHITTTDPVPAEDGHFCLCGRPFLFGEIMFKCEGYCGNWYHPKCLGMYAAEVRRLRGKKDRWYCDECLKQAYSLMLFCSVVKVGKK